LLATFTPAPAPLRLPDFAAARGDLLLGRLRARDQRLRRLLRFRARHLRQDERDRDEADQGQTGDDEKYGAHMLFPL
jgi:hypothetical protein